jgi:dynactin 1
MAEERAEQAEAELEMLREKLEERDMELDVLRSEAELFTADMSPEEREQAGYYRLQHENDRLREALIALKEMTGEQEQDLKATIRELEADVNQIEPLREEVVTLQERVAKADDIIEHLQGQVDANSEWEVVHDELSAKAQDLEEQVAEKILVIRDLESIKELNDELELQHIEQEDELRAELDARDVELAQQAQRIAEQTTIIADHEELVSKFRDLVYELQGKMADAESSRNMTEAQAKDTTGRFNEVMDLNRRLRSSNVNATKKEITSELRRLRGDEASEKLAIWTETGSSDFGNSESLRAYFVAKSIASKATLVSSLLTNTDRQLSYNGGLDEALSRLQCVEAIYHLSIIKAGGDRLWSAIAVAPLTEFGKFGPTYHELVTVERALDQGLDALRVDEVNFGELAGAFGRSTKIQEAVLSDRQDSLAALPEDETLARFRTVSASLNYLDSNMAVVNTMLRFLSTDGERLAEKASEVLERFAGASTLCNKAMLGAQKLLKLLDTLRQDSLYPRYSNDIERIIQEEAFLTKLARNAAEWGQKAVTIVSKSFEPDGTFNGLSADLHDLLMFYWSAEVDKLETTVYLLDSWVEHASILMNNSEIEHGPSPWTQMAKEAEITRKKNEEASVLLENLKAEHKATRLSLLEREQVIETKSLEIEHLEAKYRDATNKVGEQQRLHDKIMQLEQEVLELEKRSRAQTAEIESLKERTTRSDRSDHDAHEPNTTTSAVALEPTEQAAAARNLPAGLHSLVGALQDENHWLRQRENAEYFERNLRTTFTKMKCATKWERVIKGGPWIDEEWLSDEEADDFLPDTYKAKYGSQKEQRQRERAQKEADTRLKRTEQTEAEAGPKRSPLALEPVRDGWQSRSESPMAALHRMHDYVSERLSPIDEGYDEGNTADLEGFSEMMI